MALRNDQFPPGGHIRSWDDYAKKILSTASPVLPAASNLTWVCLLALPGSCAWMINYAGSCVMMTDSQRIPLSRKLPRLS